MPKQIGEEGYEDYTPPESQGEWTKDENGNWVYHAYRDPSVGAAGGYRDPGYGGPPPADDTQEQRLPPWQEEQVRYLLEQARAWFDQQGNLLAPGQTVAGFDPSELAGQQGLLDYAGGALQDLIGRTSKAHQFALGDVLSPDSNPYLAKYGDALSRDFARQFTELINPAIKGGALAAGQTGGSRQGIAQGLAAGRSAEAAQTARSKFYSDAYNRGLTTFEKALAFSPEMAELGAMPFTLQSGVGAQRRAQEQSILDAKNKADMFNQLAPLFKLHEFQSLIQGQYGGEGETPPPPSSDSGGENLWETIRDLLGL